MRRIALNVLAGLVLVTATGCVAVASRTTRYSDPFEAVSVNDRVYLINTHSGEVHEIDLSTTTPFKKDVDDD